MKLQELLGNIFISSDAWMIHLAATLLNHHHMEMTEIELNLCTDIILKANPDNKGTVNEIDQAMVGLLARFMGFFAFSIAYCKYTK